MEVKVNIMSSINRRFFILGIMLISSISTVFAGTLQNNLLNVTAFGNSAQASLITGKTGYVKDDTVIIYGEGFGSFEDISLSVENYNDALKENVALMRWSVFADKSGSFVASIPFDSLSSESGRYTLKAFGSKTKASAEATILNAIAAAGNLDQCANGGIGDPVEPCSGAGWVNGAVNDSKAHWIEGQSLAYRQILTGFTPGSTGHTVTIGYDTTKGGKHALDYLTSFDRTETLAMGNNPCSGVVGCSLGTFTTFPIPVDPNVTAGFDQIPANSDDITQIPGNFTLFGGTITGVSGYTVSGSFAGDSHTSITITFTANSADMVLSWGGHIGTRTDWGVNNSAVFISGSPYHMSQDACSFGCGSQDRALSASAVIAPASIVIIKDSQPNSLKPFSFTATGSGVSNFSLVDNGVIGPDRTTFSGLTNFGAGNAVSIIEGTGSPYSLIAINCNSNPYGGSGVNNNTTSVLSRNATIVLEAGEIVTCTFVNAVTTAANVSASGKVTDAFGQPISRTRVTIQNTTTLETQIVYTNTFGNYRFDNLPAGDFYIVSVSNRRYVFAQDTQSFTLNDAIENVDFIAQE